jgi:thioredoxin reductase
VSHPEVIIVGGGPAGLSAAIELRKRGVDRVTVLEREHSAGGVPRHTAHLGYGMRDLHRVTTGPRYAAALVRAAERADITIRTDTAVHTIADLHADAIVLATGVRERPRSARMVPGDRPAGVYTTGSLQQFVALHHQRVGTRAVVVGAEHVSFSAMLTLAHAGCTVAAMVTPFAQHQSYRTLVLATSGRHRVPIRTGADVAEIVGRTRVESVVLTDGTRIECDTVVFTGDWIPDHELARRAGLAMVPVAKAPLVDAGMHTDRRGVFAIGNLVHPAETADVCALDGRAVAASVLDFLTTARWPEQVWPVTVDDPIAWASFDHRGISLRVREIVHGQIRLTHSGEVQWLSAERTWLPNRSITIPHAEMRTTTRPFADHRIHVDLIR